MSADPSEFIRCGPVGRPLRSLDDLARMVAAGELDPMSLSEAEAIAFLAWIRAQPQPELPELEGVVEIDLEASIAAGGIVPIARRD